MPVAVPEPGVDGTVPAVGRRLRILVVSTVFPSAAAPHHGLFVRRRLRSLPPEIEARVLAPAPWFPGASGLRPGFRPRLPRRELDDGVAVEHPRFLSVPGVLKCCDGVSLFLTLWRAARRLRRDFAFDLIDSHFAYPEGFAAVLLGIVSRVPVVLTLRGTLPQVARYRLRRPQAAFALRRAARVIALSDSLRAEAVRLGCSSDRIRVVPNGVDAALFRPLPRQESRRMLGLDPVANYVLTVGSVVRRKGIHLVIEAIAELRSQGLEVRYLIVGGPAAEGWEGTALRRQIDRLGVGTSVWFAGQRPAEELAEWYSAADAFVLPSALEGSSNVLLEALACGTPIIATPTGEAPELVASSGGGILLPRADAAAVAGGIRQALARSWDRSALCAFAAGRSWDAVAEAVSEEFRAALR